MQMIDPFDWPKGRGGVWLERAGSFRYAHAIKKTQTVNNCRLTSRTPHERVERVILLACSLGEKQHFRCFAVYARRVHPEPRQPLLAIRSAAFVKIIGCDIVKPKEV